jgi:hypothetical protein
VAAVSAADAWDGPLSALRSHIESLAVWLAIWSARSEPDAHARRCAADAWMRSTRCWESCTWYAHG